MSYDSAESVVETRLPRETLQHVEPRRHVEPKLEWLPAPASSEYPFELLPTPWYQRLIEIPIALAALAVFLPLMLVEAVIIRLDSPGPALFFQQRMGIGTKPFWFVKFRTLYADAKQRHPDLYSYQYTDQELRDLKFKVMDDPRVTRAGKWLRNSTIDELPNFWCLLTGDMALVGPRPEIPEMLKYYEGEMLRKFQVRPGITGLAQISGRGRLGFHETVDLDVEYVKNRSFWFDCKIVLKTIKCVVLRDGAF